MAEKDKSFVDEMRERTEVSDDALIEELSNVQRSVKRATQETDARMDSLEKEADGIKQRVAKQADALKDYINNGFEVVEEKLNRMEQRQIATGRMTLIEPSDSALSAISEADRKHVHQMEGAPDRNTNVYGGKVRGYDGAFGDPIFGALTGLWFRDVATLQHSKIRPGADPARIRENVERYERAFADYGKTKAVSDLLEGTDAIGGYLVPTPVQREINRLIEDNTVVRPFARKITMTTPSLELPKKGNAITAYIGAEGSTLTGSYDETAFSMVTMNAKRFHGRATLSIELFEDSIVGLMDYIQTTIAEEIGILEDQEALEGSSNFTGVNSESGVVSKSTTTTDGEALTYQDLVDVVFGARQRASRNNARWFMAPETLAQVVGLVDSNGQPIVKYGTVPNAIQPTLLGFPVESVSTIAIDTTRGSTSNTTNIYFGPPTGIVFGDRTGMRFDVSDAPNWGNYKVDLRLVKRTGIVVAVPTAFTKLVGITYS